MNRIGFVTILAAVLVTPLGGAPRAQYAPRAGRRRQLDSAGRVNLLTVDAIERIG